VQTHPHTRIVVSSHIRTLVARYQTAAVLSRRVPKISGGADVLQLSADGCKALYYFPDDGVRRVILSTTADIKQVRHCCICLR
jgi:hypothetical protein